MTLHANAALDNHTSSRSVPSVAVVLGLDRVVLKHSSNRSTAAQVKTKPAPPDK